MWDVEFHADFDPEYEALDEAVQDELLAQLKLLETFGPQLGRPRVDTLNLMPPVAYGGLLSRSIPNAKRL